MRRNKANPTRVSSVKKTEPSTGVSGTSDFTLHTGVVWNKANLGEVGRGRPSYEEMSVRNKANSRTGPWDGCWSRRRRVVALVLDKRAQTGLTHVDIEDEGSSNAADRAENPM